jgi:pimeloyl-ACP methyl ester carboxylesterase
MSDFELNVAGHLGDESFSQPMLLEPTGSGDNPIISVNGIRNDQLLATDLAREVSKISGRDVQPVYNPTRNPVFDLAQTALVNKPDIPDSTTQLVARTISEQLTRLPASQNLTVVGHSQGAAIDAAAFTRLTPAERGRIDFVSIGGAACHAPADLNSRTFIINTRDFVPMVAGAGFAPCRGVMEAEGSVSYKYYSFGDLSPKTSHGAQSYRIAIQTQEPSNSALESEARALLRSAAIGMMKLDPAGQRMKAAVMMMP